ncbi:MAG TPA: DUF433 domain-containing protein [Candidatus Competibacteraceae bacterium]|nr:DUF433 domain-containing protein [Candidatus Competibacteraceae bacterium]HQA27240.1 DUF433 domain-containing protein [Candidatus Competibacteraceae bacterium]HQD57981.1 DUF433 domain-containing protein [Candidatus Competibacteraceae bacterium]
MIGTGLYTIGEIATFTHIPARQVRRWLRGYRSGKQTYPPLWSSELSNSPLPQAFGFHDLLEVRIVHAFRRYGVSLPTIRKACQHARDYFNRPYPFACQRFLTDGRSVFAEILEQTGDAEDAKLLDMARKQYVFEKVVRPSLYAGIEYDPAGIAQRWFPLNDQRRIVLDPARNFGKPILAASGVPTEALFAAYRVEQDNRRVAAIYEVPVADVEAAIHYEQQLDAQRSAA